ncbi:MAG TPA: flavodoxin domain-containing protein [Erysipelothrix sp.]
MSSIALVYWSGTGNTQMMAESMADVLEEYDSELIFEYVDDADINLVNEKDLIILGCPAMTGETIEEFEFRPFFDEIKPHLNGKKVILFGSYDWGGGEWLNSWTEEVSEQGGEVIKTFKIQWDPQEDQLEVLQNELKTTLDEM